MRSEEVSKSKAMGERKKGKEIGVILIMISTGTHGVRRLGSEFEIVVGE